MRFYIGFAEVLHRLWHSRIHQTLDPNLWIIDLENGHSVAMVFTLVSLL